MSSKSTAFLCCNVFSYRSKTRETMRSPYPSFVRSAYDVASKPAFFSDEIADCTRAGFISALSQPNPTGGFSAMQRPPAL